MKSLNVSILALILFALPAFGQTACPTGYSCVPVNGGLTAQIPEPVGQAAGPVVQAAEQAVAAKSSITYLPKFVVTAGGGGTIPGKGRFVYWSASQYIGQQTYGTIATEYSILNNQIMTCPKAGMTKILYQWSSLSVGLTGLGGACTSGSSSVASATAQGFLSWHIRRSAWSIVATAIKTTDGKFTLTLAPARAD